jgi:hypothetical protein
LQAIKEAGFENKKETRAKPRNRVRNTPQNTVDQFTNDFVLQPLPSASLATTVINKQAYFEMVENHRAFVAASEPRVSS